MNSNIEMSAFKRLVAEAAAWCAKRADAQNPLSSLRTQDLEPPSLIDVPALQHMPNIREPPFTSLSDDRKLIVYREAYQTRVLPLASSERQAIVTGLTEKRAELLRLRNDLSHVLTQDGLNGRLLICTSDNESVMDGASQFVSKGFFDMSDLPPWDTWIYYVTDDRRHGQDYSQPYLISWVPPMMITFANAGIEANPVDCIHWATEHDTDFIHQLKITDLLR